MSKKKTLDEEITTITKKEITKALGKHRRFNMRLSPAEFESIKLTAAYFDMNMSEYFLRLHELVKSRLKL